MKRVTMLLLVMLAQMAGLRAQTIPAAPQAEFVQHLDAQLPLDMEVVDDEGMHRRLGDFFDRQPVVVVPGYFHCPNLCSTLMEGVLQSFADVRLKDQRFRLVAISIDPRETAELTARKKLSYAPMLGTHGGDLHLLTSTEKDIARFARAAGFQYAYDPSLQQYVHPAGFLVATPDGRISRYLMGVRFDPALVRQALSTAEAGSIGSPVERLLLLCAHFDPRNGRNSAASLLAVRAICLAVLGALVLWIWRHRGRREQAK
jgi:protein SCO1/2